MSGSLEIRPYEPAWAAQFESERERLEAALGPLAVRIDHHGSTSVPGLAAKPVIDIQVSVRSLQPLAAYGEPLAALGYSHLPHDDDRFAPFFYRPAAWPHSHHVHVVEAGGEEERKTLAFRDYLREHEEVARRYEALKLALAADSPAADAASREEYAEAKGEFVVAVTARALAEGYPLRNE